MRKKFLIEFHRPQDAIRNFFRHQLIEEKISLVLIITGGTVRKTGIGKTWTAVKIAKTIWPDFDENYYTIMPDDYLNALKKIEDSGKAGRVVIFDEGEVTLSSREWFSFLNRAVANTIAIYRDLRCLSIIIAPMFNDLDIRVRKLCNYWGIPDRHGDKVIFKLYQIKTDMQSEKYFWPKVDFYNSEKKQVVKPKWIEVTPPDAEMMKLIEKIEQKTNDFRRLTRRNFLREAIEMRETITKEGAASPAESRLEMAQQLLALPHIVSVLQEKGRINRAHVFSEFDAPTTYVQDVVNMVNSKWRASKRQQAIKPAVVVANG